MSRNGTTKRTAALAAFLSAAMLAGVLASRADDVTSAADLTTHAFAQAARGRLTAAKQDLAAALRLDPAFPRALALRGGIEIVEDDPTAAMADLDSAIAGDPSYAPAFFDRARVHLMRGERDRALTDFTAALKIDPAHAASLANRGLTRVVTGDLGGARADFEAALALAPANDRIIHAQEIAREGLASVAPGAP